MKKEFYHCIKFLLGKCVPSCLSHNLFQIRHLNQIILLHNLILSLSYSKYQYEARIVLVKYTECLEQTIGGFGAGHNLEKCVSEWTSILLYFYFRHQSKEFRKIYCRAVFVHSVF